MVAEPGLDRIAPVAFDTARIEAAVSEILEAIGEDPSREGLRQTPARVARAYEEMFRGLREDPEKVLTTTFELDHDEMILVKDIEVASTCEHHLVPFYGYAHVAYIPGRDGRITGLSKLARLVDVFATLPAARAGRRDGRDRGRAPVYDHARGSQARREDAHQCRAGPAAQPRNSGRGDEPHHRALTAVSGSGALAPRVRWRA